MIADGYKKNFKTLLEAVGLNDVCLLECTDAATGKPVMAICALNRTDEGEVMFVPIAKMFDGNPYEELMPPDMDPEQRA
jgi:hypothetical protein